MQTRRSGTILPFDVCFLPFALRKAGPAHSARVVRGGAFNNNHRNVRCAYRNRNNPNNWNNNIGFRVAALTFFTVRIAVRFAAAGFTAATKNGGAGSGPRCRQNGAGQITTAPFSRSHRRKQNGAIF
ncbi:hypothetical protein DCC62_28205 [candidate division KSB1 bacterium]|nr:MAG: hypothetical protein DCC62_28205 [candidate division KSB1 bacterium]